MNFKNYTEGTRATHGTDPNEDTTDAILCTFCASDLTPEEIENNEEDEKFCDLCFFSCCGDELDQDIRICPTCKEHN